MLMWFIYINIFFGLFALHQAIFNDNEPDPFSADKLYYDNED